MVLLFAVNDGYGDVGGSVEFFHLVGSPNISPMRVMAKLSVQQARHLLVQRLTYAVAGEEN